MSSSSCWASKWTYRRLITARGHSKITELQNKTRVGWHGKMFLASIISATLSPVSITTSKDICTVKVIPSTQNYIPLHMIWIINAGAAAQPQICNYWNREWLYVKLCLVIQSRMACCKHIHTLHHPEALELVIWHQSVSHNNSSTWYPSRTINDHGNVQQSHSRMILIKRLTEVLNVPSY